MPAPESNKKKRIFHVSEGTNLILKLKLIDKLLKDYSTGDRIEIPLPEGKTLADYTGQLNKDRKRLLEEIDNFQVDLKQFDKSMEEIKGYGPAKKSSFSLRKVIETVTTDSQCEPLEEETVTIEPSEVNIYVDPAVTVSTEENDAQSTVTFEGYVEDTNNDPFNHDISFGTFWIEWVYPLPERVFDTRQEISIYGGLDVGIKAYSNNIFGRRDWCGAFSGVFMFEGEVYSQGEACMFPVPIYKFQDWTDQDKDFSFPGRYFTRTINLEAGQTNSLGLVYGIHLGANLCKNEAIGYVCAHKEIEQYTPPHATCVIYKE